MPSFDHPGVDLKFLSPMSSARADELATFLRPADDGRAGGLVLDVGCGWGEFLLRVLEHHETAVGLGVDLDGRAVEMANNRAFDRGLATRATFIEGYAAEHLPDRVNALSCIGATHALQEGGAETCQYGPVLAQFRELLPRGGRLVYGESIWSRQPTAAAMASLGGRPDEFISLGDLVREAGRCGFAVAGWSEATMTEWDAFESGFGAGYARWLTEHASQDPQAESVRERIRSQHTRYFEGYRGVLGLGYLKLIAV